MSPKEKMANLSLNFMPHKAIKVNRKFFTGQHDVLDMPNLIEAQIRSYKWFWEKGLKELVQEINSIKDFTGKNLELFFGDYYLDKPKYDEKTANEEMLAAVADVDTNPDMRYMQNTLEKDPSKTADEGFKEVYKRIRPGDLATVDNARSLIEAMFFNADRYDLSEVGRYKLNQRLNIKDRADRVLTKSDLTDIVREVIRLNNSQGAWDDIDHLSNRRVKSVGELIQGKFRIGLARMSRIAKDRMSLADIETVTPAQLIHVRPIVAVIQEFFSSSQ